MTTQYRLFTSIMARKNPLDGGGSMRVLKARTMKEAEIEAKAIIEERAPEDGCDFFCDFAVIVEATKVHILRKGME